MEMLAMTAVVIVLGHLALGVILWLRVRKLYCYPGLLGFPVIGNLYYFYKTMFLGSMDSMEKYMTNITDKYGKNGLCFHWAYCSRTSVLISSPQLVKETAFHPNLCDKPDNMYGGFIPYLEGPFASFRADDLWKLKRKEYNTGLKKSHLETVCFNSFNKCADKLIDLMLASYSAVDVLYETIGVAQNVTMETFFGFETKLAYDPQIVNIMTVIMPIGSFLGANPILSGIILNIFRRLDKIFLKKVEALRQSILEEVDKAFASNQGPRPASRCLKSNGSKKKWNKMDLMTEIQELFFTSSQTVASALANSIIFLAVLPDIQERAWKEQKEIFGDDNRDPTIEDIKQMQFLERFIKEALRFLGPPFLGKLARDDININGIIIPRGANVIYLTRYMRMDPKYWKDPEIFEPDRFLEDSDTLKYSYSPFGIGVRSCPGMYFATAMMKITLSKILRRLKLRPVEKDLQFKDIHLKSYVMTEVENPPALCVEERI